jgi:hypothetical protein
MEELHRWPILAGFGVRFLSFDLFVHEPDICRRKSESSTEDAGIRIHVLFHSHIAVFRSGSRVFS